MPYIYFKKQWYEGNDRDTDPKLLDPQPEDMPKPTYRPGMTVKYRTPKGKTHIGKIYFVFREGPGRLDFYRIIRTRNDQPEIAFECTIIERIIND